MRADTSLGEDASYNSTTGEFYGAHPVVAKTDGDGKLRSKTIVYEEGSANSTLEVVEVSDGYIIGESSIQTITVALLIFVIKSMIQVIWFGGR